MGFNSAFKGLIERHPVPDGSVHTLQISQQNQTRNRILVLIVLLNVSPPTQNFLCSGER
jgi:hypothetical protein